MHLYECLYVCILASCVMDDACVSAPQRGRLRSPTGVHHLAYLMLVHIAGARRGGSCAVPEVRAWLRSEMIFVSVFVSVTVSVFVSVTVAASASLSLFMSLSLSLEGIHIRIYTSRGMYTCNVIQRCAVCIHICMYICVVQYVYIDVCAVRCDLRLAVCIHILCVCGFITFTQKFACCVIQRLLYWFAGKRLTQRNHEKCSLYTSAYIHIYTYIQTTIHAKNISVTESKSNCSAGKRLTNSNQRGAASILIASLLHPCRTPAPFPAFPSSTPARGGGA